MSIDFLHLPQQFLRELGDPAILWGILTLAGSLGAAFWLQWRFHLYPMKGGETPGAAGQGLRRIVFPLSALLLVLVGRAVLRPHFPVGLLDLAVPLLLSLALVRTIVFSLRYAFPGARWLSGSERLIAGVVWTGFALHLTGLAGPLIEALESIKFTVGKQKLDLWLILHGAVTALSTVFVALWLAGWLEHRLMRSEGIDAGVRGVLARAGKSVLAVVALLVSLTLAGIDITALSVFGGAFAVGLGFGMKTIASNYVAGFMILLDRSIRIGNIIAIDATTTGEVKQITTRYTVVRTLGGTEVIVPNEYLVTNIVRNQTYTDSKVCVTLSLQVAYNADLEQAMRLMIEAASAQERVLDDPKPWAAIVGFGESGIDLRLGFWIRDPEGGSGGLSSAINLAIWRSFREHGIEFPFPQREVRLLNAGELASSGGRS
ncbi:MAG: mechanosensitive ion channel [Azospira sp.]|jgi:small-conductance mechanosensitive channel|nr:mechanosensitive ion channel [Azospira sp.]